VETGEAKYNMHPDLEKILKELPGHTIQVPLPDISLAMFQLEALIARVQTIETFVIQHIADHECKEYEAVRNEFEELLAQNLADVASEFFSKYSVDYKKPDDKKEE
jgi:hypothetical protein